MSMSRAEIEAWATAYIEAEQSPDLLKDDFPLQWALDRFALSISKVDPEDCWVAILEVLSRNPPDTVWSVLAAGPLEDLINYHGRAFIERIEMQAQRDPAFRELLGGVWKTGEDAVWERVERVRDKIW